MHRICFDARYGIIAAHRRLRDRRYVLAVPRKRLIRMTDLRPPMRRRLAVLVEIDEHHLLDSQDALARDLVADFAAQRDRRAAEVRRDHTELDDVASTRRADEIDLRHELRDNALVVELADRIDRGFFVDPAQQATAEQHILFQTTSLINLSYTHDH